MPEPQQPQAPESQPKPPQSNISSRHAAVYDQLDNQRQAEAAPTTVPAVQPAPIVPPAIPIPQPELTTPPPEAQPQSAEPEKLFAGKYKSVEELEKGYQEVQRAFHEKAQKASELEKKFGSIGINLNQLSQEQVAQKTAEAVAQDPDLLDLMVNDPKQFEATLVQRVGNQLHAVQQVQTTISTWESKNPDLVNYKHWVDAEVRRLVTEDPDSLGDINALLEKATNNIRSFGQQSFAAGKQETVQMQGEANKFALAPGQGQEHQPQPVPAPAGDPLDEYISARKKEYQRVSQGAGGGIGTLRRPIGQ